jgi:hypothetical protein
VAIVFVRRLCQIRDRVEEEEEEEEEDVTIVPEDDVLA